MRACWDLKRKTVMKIKGKTNTVYEMVLRFQDKIM